MDSFLHLPPSLFKRLITGRGQLPLVSVIKDSKKEAELMWAVEDDSAPETLKVSIIRHYFTINRSRCSSLYNLLMRRIIFPF